jgi:hypothetical protein
MTPERELGERGLSDAIDRLAQSMVGGSWDAVPFTEALFWVVALRDYHKQSNERIEALSWARNFAAHDLITLGDVLPLGSVGILAWVIADLLPESKWAQANPTKTDRKMLLYVQWVQNQRLLDPLMWAQDFFRSLP